MKIYEYQDIKNDLTLFQKGTNFWSTNIYLRNDHLYKIYHPIFTSKKMELIEQLKNFDDLLYCALPDGIILHNNKLIGITIPYYQDYQTMQELFLKNNLSLPEKLEITRKIIAALKSLHEHHIIHNDLHMANILINQTDLKFIDLDDILLPEMFVFGPESFPQLQITDLFNCTFIILSFIYELDFFSFVYQSRTNFLNFAKQIFQDERLISYLNTLLYNQNPHAYPDLFLKQCDEKTITKQKKIIAKRKEIL